MRSLYRDAALDIPSQHPASPPPRRPASWSRLVRPFDRLVAAVDDAADRLWTSRLNPLHQSGTLAVVSFGVLVTTGIYLFLFYSIDGPYESVSRIEHELPGGGWVRSLHAYAADLALVSIVVHALKMFLAGRFSGARLRAWLTGVVLVGVVLLCAWTGQVMAWDLQAQVVAVELTRLLDLLPVFSMPMSRAFDGLVPVPNSFFFMNLFLHVCLPLGIALILWVHLSRIARPSLLPPRPVVASILVILAVISAGLPVFSMPMSRAFDGLVPVPNSFFFMNLFLHVCLPLGIALILWVHLSRIARPSLLPPRPVVASILVILAVISAGLPVPIAAPADMLVIPKNVPIDVLFNFWLPVAWKLGPAWHAAIWALATVTFVSVPWWWRGSRPVLAPSWADPDRCTGCTTCYKDCPFDAITMVARADPGRRSEFHALVNPDRCVACGICAGSCAPMSVGPPAFTGRMQLRREHERLATGYLSRGDIVVFACSQNPVATDPRLAALPGVKTRVVECAGGLHTSVLDVTIRGGAAGVCVLTCPPRSAPCREGPKWLHERVYNDREAELPPRVDKRRVAIASFSRGEWPAIEATIRDLRETVRELAPAMAARGPIPVEDVDMECEPEREVLSA